MMSGMFGDCDWLTILHAVLSVASVIGFAFQVWAISGGHTRVVKYGQAVFVPIWLAQLLVFAVWSLAGAG
jgi:hypothetical protein